MTAVVNLTPEEVEFAALAGALRQARAIARGIPDRYGQVKNPWQRHIEGAGAEYAVAKFLKLYYVPALHVQTSGGDVNRYQVRSTEKPDGCLLIKDGDRDEDVFILVVGTMPNLTVAGWLRARDGRRDEWRRNPGVGRSGCWFVPQSALREVPRP